MLAYFTKPILELVPEATELIKKASLEQDLPVDSRDSVIASALAITYASEITGQHLDLDAMTKVASAVNMYDLERTLAPYKQALVKRAHAKNLEKVANVSNQFLEKQAAFGGDSVENRVASAKEVVALFEKQAAHTELSEDVQRYAGLLPMNKKAAVEALASRFHYSGNTGFAKLACAIGNLPESGVKQATIQDICDTVNRMDHQLGLHFQGYDFYREALITKQAAISALTVKLGGKSVPYESIERAGRSRVAQYIGEDVAKEMDAGPENAKAVLETLPADLQTLLLKVIDNA